ncbi:MAG: hypothetical protein ACYC91_09870 [Solirubrobacteraceae bacterium]
MADPQQLRARYTRVMSAAMVVVGIALIARTLAAGAGPFTAGVLLGILFVIAGLGRLYLQLRAP